MPRRLTGRQRGLGSVERQHSSDRSERPIPLLLETQADVTPTTATPCAPAPPGPRCRRPHTRSGRGHQCVRRGAQRAPGRQQCAAGASRETWVAGDLPTLSSLGVEQGADSILVAVIAMPVPRRRIASSFVRTIQPSALTSRRQRSAGLRHESRLRLAPAAYQSRTRCRRRCHQQRIDRRDPLHVRRVNDERQPTASGRAPHCRVWKPKPPYPECPTGM